MSGIPGQKGHTPWNKDLTKETCSKLAEIGIKISRARLGKSYPKLSEAKKGSIPWNKEVKGYHNRPYPSSHRDSKTRSLLSKITKAQWQNLSTEERERRIKIHIGILKNLPTEVKEEALRKAWQALGKKPTKAEVKLGELIEEACPGEYIYTGDFSFMVQGYCPDYTNINGQKKIIELFGNYWHKEGSDVERIRLFKSFGYNCLVIWENELINKPREEIINLVKEFSRR